MNNEKSEGLTPSCLHSQSIFAKCTFLRTNTSPKEAVNQKAMSHYSVQIY